jgi:prevent-host-death family protein
MPPPRAEASTTLLEQIVALSKELQVGAIRQNDSGSNCWALRSGGVHRVEFDLQENDARLSRIVERCERGEEVVIYRAGRPVAKVIPLATALPRTGRGALAGQLIVAPDWDEAGTNACIANDFDPR